ncbi:MAG: DNA replication protein [Alphaproteobacteria bacterium]|nr:DNA replication protein [Alphaproteobacteria bacterium]MBF0251218.1 DNA replication protein [Alphaproteobacteria bacterium]
MTFARQIPLPFDPRPALGGEDFLVAPSNAGAVAWVERWPDWPSPGLVIVGDAGAGKTHLCHVFQALSGARPVTPETLGVQHADGVLDGAGALALDDAEGFLAAGLAEELLHLYNLAREGDVKFLLSAKAPPARWRVDLKDLSSRLNTLPVAEIDPPDDVLLTALIVKQFGDRQLAVDPDVLSYMLARMERTFAGVRDLIRAVDELALAEKRAVTKALVRRVLEGGDAAAP